jgi:hypothetical protein
MDKFLLRITIECLILKMNDCTHYKSDRNSAITVHVMYTYKV